MGGFCTAGERSERGGISERAEWAIEKQQFIVWFPFKSTGLSEAERCPLKERSQFSDVECSEQCHVSRPGSRHASYFTEKAPLLAPQIKVREKVGGQRTARQRKCVWFTSTGIPPICLVAHPRILGRPFWPLELVSYTLNHCSWAGCI